MQTRKDQHRKPVSRGVLGNPKGRFATTECVPCDDSRGIGEGIGEEAEPPRATVVRNENTRRIITRNASPDVFLEQTVNPYRGCEHGCIYCYARPSHAYIDLSPGLDFESKLVAKPQAAERLRDELSRPSYRCRPIGLGSNTDVYQPIERRLRLTRALLSILAETSHPVHVTTKSALVARDLDLLAPLAERGLVRVMISINTLDRAVARELEPRAPTPELRLATLHRLSQAGVPTGVLCAPVIPAVNDSQIESVLAAARDAGVTTAGFELVRLPHELKGIFVDWLGARFPERERHVLGLLRSARNGELDDPRFGLRMRGMGPYADMIEQRFTLACRRLGLSAEMPALCTTAFARPGSSRPGRKPSGAAQQQLDLLAWTSK